MARKQYVPSAAEVVAARINATMKEDVVTLGSDTKYEIERVPTGILTIDRLLHGGFARGRHVELFGDWLTGKSLVMYSTMALAQERGEVCALVDAENVFSARWFKRLGGNPNDLIMAEAKNAHTLGNVIRVMVWTSSASTRLPVFSRRRRRSTTWTSHYSLPT
jgi:RecA/RadA recombinase